MLVGHEKQWQFLTRSAISGKLPHALLFYGQEHLGKRTFAIEFAKYLNCQDRKSNGPCQKCRNCQDIQKNLYPDFLVVEPELLSKEIQISQIRCLIEKLSFRPYSAKIKIAVLTKAHLMSQEAQNCFLKFLEEPLGEVLLILITEHPYSLLLTILSRIQKIKFFLVENEKIKKFLKEKEAGNSELSKILPLASGRPGLAINFSEAPEKLKEREKFVSDLGELAVSDLVFRFKYAENIAGESFDFAKRKEILGIWLECLRNLLLSRIEKRTENNPLLNPPPQRGGGEVGEHIKIMGENQNNIKENPLLENKSGQGIKIHHKDILKWTILAVAVFAIVVLIFGAGMFIGGMKARFSYRWAENYHQNFGGPREGFFGNLQRAPFPPGNFIQSRGSFGDIIKVNDSDFVIKGQGDVEKVILITKDTIIEKEASKVGKEELKIGDRVVVIGSPNDQGQIAAKLIRIFNPIQNDKDNI